MEYVVREKKNEASEVKVTRHTHLLEVNAIRVFKVVKAREGDHIFMRMNKDSFMDLCLV